MTWRWRGAGGPSEDNEETRKEERGQEVSERSLYSRVSSVLSLFWLHGTA